MNITDDLIYSMLSYSKNYQPYVYDWGKRVGRDLIKERLEIEASMKLKSENIFEQGLISGALEELTSKNVPFAKMRYTAEELNALRNKAIKSLPNPELLRVSYPHIHLSSGSHTLLYWIGKEAGVKFGKKHDHKISELKKISDNLKIGDIEITNNKIILNNSVFAKNFINPKKKVCSYYAGFAAGFLSSDKKKYNVIETKCIARGDKKCEFTLISF